MVELNSEITEQLEIIINARAEFYKQFGAAQIELEQVTKRCDLADTLHREIRNLYMDQFYPSFDSEKSAEKLAFWKKSREDGLVKLFEK